MQRKAKAAVARATSDLAYKASEGVTNPLEELQKLVTESIILKDTLAEHVNSLKGDLVGTSFEGAEYVRGQILLYERAMDRTGKFLDYALKHNLEDKKIQIQAKQAELVAAALFRVLTSLQLDNDQMDEAKQLLHHELTTITAEPQEAS